MTRPIEQAGIVQHDLSALERRIDELIRTCEALKNENRELRIERNRLSSERTDLVNKTGTARARLETLIGRLRAMERDA